MNKITERTIKQINKDRRRFLEMVGKAGISTSVLKVSGIAGAMMSSRFAEAQAGTTKKMILIFHPNGSPNGRYLDGAAMAPFEGLDGVAALEMTIGKPGGHGNIHQAAGAESYNGSDANGSTINMQAAKVIGSLTPYSSIQLGVQSGTQGNFNKLNGADVSLSEGPSVALASYFGSAPPPVMSGGGGAETGPTIFDRRRSVLDANKLGLDVLSKKLGMDELGRLEGHLSALEKLENKIRLEEEQAAMNASGGDDAVAGGGGGSCSAPSIASGGSALQQYKAQGDIAVAALACNLTNVVSIQFSDTQAGWLPNDGTADAVAFNADHHQANHGGGADLLPQIVGYMNKGVAHIVNGLKQAGIYDQTVVVVVSEMGDGQDHSQGNGPIVIASGMISGNPRKNVGSDHYNVFPDVFRMMGLESSVGGMIHDYGAGGVV